MKAHRQEFWTPTIERFGGRVVGGAGDSILVEFASAVAAVESSIVVQLGMVDRNGGLSDDRRMLLRIGINLGEVVIEGDDIYGDGVNVAARLQEIAEPGGIALSGNIHEQIEGKLEGTFTDDGLHEVKNIVRPVHVWRDAGMFGNTLGPEEAYRFARGEATALALARGLDRNDPVVRMSLVRPSPIILHRLPTKSLIQSTWMNLAQFSHRFEHLTL